jgi:excisionase family DNA binding protein
VPASASAGPVPPASREVDSTHRVSAAAERHERLTYNVDEIAQLLGISRSTAYECVRRGEIPSVRFGRRIVVVRSVVEGLLREVATPTAPTD